MNHPESVAKLEEAKPKMTAAQFAKIERLILGYENQNKHTGCTEVRIRDISFIGTNGWKVCVSIETHRSDCGEASPRQVLCREGGYFFIGRRGGAKMVTDYRVRSKPANLAQTLRLVLWRAHTSY